MQTTSKVRPLAVTAMLSAVGCVLMMLDFPLPMLIPAFVKMDVSELPALLASFSLGPVYGILVCLLKNLLAAIFHGSTLGIGEVCNFLMGAVFTGVAGLIYQRRKTRRSAVVASLVGAAAMAAASVPINFFLSYPVYAAAFGGMDPTSTSGWSPFGPAHRSPGSESRLRVNTYSGAVLLSSDRRAAADTDPRIG